jgi:hypothetical protein
MISVVGARGLGKLIAFGLLRLHGRICRYIPKPVAHTELQGVPSIFFDKEYIKNLKAV